jgi:hypothetical protein
MVSLNVYCFLYVHTEYADEPNPEVLKMFLTRSGLVAWAEVQSPWTTTLSPLAIVRSMHKQCHPRNASPRLSQRELAEVGNPALQGRAEVSITSQGQGCAISNLRALSPEASHTTPPLSSSFLFYLSLP